MLFNIRGKYSESLSTHIRHCVHYIRVTLLLHSINVNKIFSLLSPDPLSSHFLVTYWEDETLAIKNLSPFS